MGLLVIEDLITALKNKRLGQYGHVLRKNENDFVKRSMDG